MRMEESDKHTRRNEINVCARKGGGIYFCVEMKKEKQSEEDEMTTEEKKVKNDAKRFVQRETKRVTHLSDEAARTVGIAARVRVLVLHPASFALGKKRKLNNPRPLLLLSP